MNEQGVRTVDNLVIGAGMSGLCAASALKAAGYDVVVVDKGRGIGGRMATRRREGATLDHGAQFVTARTERFERWLHQACEAGAAVEWCRGFLTAGDGHPRWRGAPGMSGLARHMGAGLPLELGRQVAALERAGLGWSVRWKEGGAVEARSVILTAPVPQSLALLGAGNVVLEASIRHRLEAIRYERCFAVLVVLDGPSHVPEPGGFVPETGPLAWIADNQKKGVSALPAVTLHARDAYSVENWDRDRDAVAKELIAAAMPWLGAGVLSYEIHGWRYSRPQETDFDPCVVLERTPPLILAGDAFGGARVEGLVWRGSCGGARVEGAALSGWAAAEALAECLGDPKSSQT